MTVTLTVNDKVYQLEDIDPGTPLLWALRDTLGLVGTKYGCGMSLCGSCTVHVDGAAMRSCQLPISALEGKSVTTIEGLATEAGELHPLQQAWVDQDVAQCGYCQSGQIMTAAALLKRNPQPTDEQIASAMAGNICRCGTYLRIASAVRAAAENINETAED